MSRRFLVAVAIAAVGTAGVGVVASIAGAASPTPSESAIPPNPAPDFPGTVTFDHVPEGFIPPVAASDAAAVALQQFPDVAVEVVESNLALFTWGAVPVDENDNPTGPPLHTAAPVWVIGVKGACSQWVPSTGDCVNDTTEVVVSASTGEFIMGYPAPIPELFAAHDSGNTDSVQDPGTYIECA